MNTDSKKKCLEQPTIAPRANEMHQTLSKKYITAPPKQSSGRNNIRDNTSPPAKWLRQQRRTTTSDKYTTTTTTTAQTTRNRTSAKVTIIGISPGKCASSSSPHAPPAWPPRLPDTRCARTHRCTASSRRRVRTG